MSGKKVFLSAEALNRRIAALQSWHHEADLDDIRTGRATRTDVEQRRAEAKSHDAALPPIQPGETFQWDDATYQYNNYNRDGYDLTKITRLPNRNNTALHYEN